MTHQSFRSFLVSFACIAISAVPYFSQTRTATPAAPAKAGAYVVPRTPWGDPDLQGLWPGNMGVPMQRPAEFGERDTLTDAEFARREAQAKAQAEADAQEFVTPGTAVGIGPPSHWTERGRPTRQASLIVDPENGRLPALTPEAEKRRRETSLPGEWRGQATRTGENTIQYEATVDDPKTWVRSWTISMPLVRDPKYGLFEYACHEGNYAMSNILSGARAAERK